MLTKVINLDALPKNTGLLVIRKGAAAVDNFFATGRLNSVDNTPDGNFWLNIDESVRVPTAPVSSIASHTGLSDVKGASPEALLSYFGLLTHLPPEKSVISYRLTGFFNKERDFPCPQYEIYSI